MPTLTRRRAALGAASAAALAATGRRRARAQAATKPIRIGVLNDPNGIYADNGGTGCVVAARLAAEEVGNSVLGRPVEVLAGDCQNKPDIAVSIARGWLDTGGVDVIVDGANSAIGLALQQLAREKERIFIPIGPATSDLTGKACSPFGFHFAYDTYALAKVGGEAVTRQGGKTWFFIVADYAFGEALLRDTTRFIEAAGGRVLGAVRHPLGATDYSSFLIQAQASGADVIALGNASVDTQNSLKQAAEFGIGRSGGAQRLVSLLIFITDVIGVGLPIAQGLSLTTSFYWDRTDATRAWTRRFMAFKDKAPTMLQAGSYSGTRHWLRAVQAVGTAETRAVADKMRELPVDDMNNAGVRIRGDGRVMCNMYLMQVKTPAESTGRFDLYKLLAAVPGDQAFRPLSEGGCPLVRS